MVQDHINSTAMTLSNFGAVTGEVIYSAWGEVRNSYGSTPTKKLYTGQYEAAAGLYFYNARWFDNEIGRFAQADSIIPEPGNPVAWDRYAYVNNNPIRYNDPSGHCIECFVLGGFMGVGALIGYGSQVAKNYQNGIQGMAAYTTNIELEPIWRGAIITGGVGLLQRQLSL